eukprot:scaffold211126_cov37-Tisochrysis_lutea.AAC.2
MPALPVGLPQPDLSERHFPLAAVRPPRQLASAWSVRQQGVNLAVQLDTIPLQGSTQRERGVPATSRSPP